jgi:hypothetical protein
MANKSEIMTDAELLGLTQVEIEIIQGLSEWGITVLTGYLLIAYVMGRNLSLFQVTFVNAVFIALVLTVIDSSLSSQRVVANLMEILHQQNPELAVQVGYERSESPAVVWLRPIVPVVILLGALAFMWSVRHPKTE